MQTPFLRGCFIESTQPLTLERYANRYPECNLVLKHNGTANHYLEQVKSLAQNVAAQRLLVPVQVRTLKQMQAQAEAISLLNDNIYVQIPIMTTGCYNYSLIETLLSEGVPVAVTGLVTRSMVTKLLADSSSETPLILMLNQATAYYDLIVCTAVTKLYPQAQLVMRVTELTTLIRDHSLALDGISLTPALLGSYQRLLTLPAGANCQLTDRQKVILK